MALDLATFQNRYPEFAQIDPDYVTAVLADALQYVPVGTWGDFTDQGHGLKTAQLLAGSPFGNGTALVNADGTTVYDKKWLKLARIVTGGIRST